MPFSQHIFGALHRELDLPIPAFTTDTSGKILTINDKARLAAARCGRDAEDASSLWSVWPQEVAEEYSVYVHDALDHSTPVVVQGVLWGGHHHTYVLPGLVDDERVALMLCFPSPRVDSTQTPEGAKLVNAKHQDGDVAARVGDTSLRVLRLMAMGMSTSEIAKSLHRSDKTVEYHRSALGKILDIRNRSDLTRIAIRQGLVDVNETPEGEGRALAKSFIEANGRGVENGKNSQAPPLASPRQTA